MGVWVVVTVVGGEVRGRREIEIVVMVGLVVVVVLVVEVVMVGVGVVWMVRCS